MRKGQQACLHTDVTVAEWHGNGEAGADGMEGTHRHGWATGRIREVQEAFESHSGRSHKQDSGKGKASTRG